MRLIDADAVFDWYVKAFDGSNGKPKIEPNEIRFSMNDIVANLSNMPTIKSEIIRCKDCKHRDPEDKTSEAEIQKMQDIEQAQLEKAFDLGREDAKADIVRCKECKYYDEINQPYPQMYCRKHSIDTSDQDFCSRAERKDDE